MKFLLAPILAIALPIIAGALASLATQWTKKAWAALDKQDATVKQGVVAFYSFALNVAAQSLGKSVCVDGAAFCTPDNLAWGTLISFALALAIHGHKKPSR